MIRDLSGSERTFLGQSVRSEGVLQKRVVDHDGAGVDENKHAHHYKTLQPLQFSSENQTLPWEVWNMAPDKRNMSTNGVPYKIDLHHTMIIP